MLRQSLCTLTMLALSAGCSMMKNMDEMHNATGHMAQATDALQSGTDHMAQTTDNLYGDSKLSTAEAREQHLKAMKEKEDQKAKIAQAAIYFGAFDFQLWKNAGQDDAEKRQSDFKKAVDEFFASLGEYVGDYDRDTSPSSTDSRSMNVYALAVALDIVNPAQVLAGERNGFKPVSMLELIETALAERNDSIPYQHTVGWNHSAAEYLLQVRSNFLAAMTLSKISDATRPWTGKLHQLGMSIARWDGNFAQLESSEVTEYTGWMTEAVRERDFLRRIGVDPKTDSGLLNVLRHLNLGMKPFQVPAAKASEKEKAHALERNAAMSRLFDAIEKFAE